MRDPENSEDVEGRANSSQLHHIMCKKISSFAKCNRVIMYFESSQLS